jgi:hypothetical protein
MGLGRVDELFRDETYGEDDEGGEVGLSLRHPDLWGKWMT